MLPVANLITREPFASLYPRCPDLVATLAKSMRENGFNTGNPIHAWPVNSASYVVLDGHTRLEAALAAGIEEVPVHRVYLGSDREALEYAVSQQRDRRNLTPAQQHAHVARAVAAMDRPKEERREAERAGSRDPGLPGPSADHTAAVVGTSSATVKRIRTVLDSGDEDTKAALLAGEITPKAAAAKVKGTAPAPRVSGRLAKTAGFKRVQRRASTDRAEAAVSALEVAAEAIAEVVVSDLGDVAHSFISRVAAATATLSKFCKANKEEK